MGKWNYRPGDAKAICDRCGFQFFHSELKKEWTGVMVCDKCFDVRHPQDVVRGVPDGKSIPNARPDPDPIFLEPGDVTADDL